MNYYVDSVLISTNNSYSGDAPFNDLERIVHNTEVTLQYMNSHFPAMGQDIKVMGYRHNKDVDLTIAIAMIADHINSVQEYERTKDEIERSIHGILDDTESGYDFNIQINALDDLSRGVDGLYLTHSGLSAESGDSGQVGRGNNPMGVIPLNRPMSAEAEAGKNSVSHVGKIYNLMCYDIAAELNGIINPDEVYVWMLSQIGQPLTEPKAVNVQLTGVDNPNSYKEIIESVVADHLDKI